MNIICAGLYSCVSWKEQEVYSQISICFLKQMLRKILSNGMESIIANAEIQQTSNPCLKN